MTFRRERSPDLPPRAASSMEHGWTIPKARLVSMHDFRACSPASTKYNPVDTSKAHVPVAILRSRGEIRLGMEFSDPGAYNPKVLPPPKTYFSKLPKDKGGFLSRRSDSPDFMMRPKGIGEVGARGGSISRSQRFTPLPGTVAGSGTLSTSNDVSLLDVPPSMRGGGVFISKAPLPRGGGTKQRTTQSDPPRVTAFEKCSIPDVSYAAARYAARSILLDDDDYTVVDDPKLKEDMRFLQVVREDLARWKLKSVLH